MAKNVNIDPVAYILHVEQQKAALTASSRFTDDEKVCFHEIFDGLIGICESKIANGIMVFDYKYL